MNAAKGLSNESLLIKTAFSPSYIGGFYIIIMNT
jgi:hypothetical protein